MKTTTCVFVYLEIQRNHCVTPICCLLVEIKRPNTTLDTLTDADVKI